MARRWDDKGGMTVGGNGFEPQRVREIPEVLRQDFVPAVPRENALGTNSSPVSDEKATPATLSAISWPEPQSLGHDLPPVPQLQRELLPRALRPWITDVAERMQVPLDIPGACGITPLAGCINRRALIQPKAADDGWWVVPTLWGGVILPPGFLKSPTLQLITQPLVEIEGLRRAEYAHESAAFELEGELFNIELAAWKESCKRSIKKGEEPPPRPDRELMLPVQRRLIITDSTFEKLHEIMHDNPAGVLMNCDELTGWLAQLDREGRQAERAFCLTA